MNHIRVFRRIEVGEGRPRYEVRSFSGRTGGVHGSVAEAARAAREAIPPGVDAFIEFRPEHDMERPLGAAHAYRCESLRPRERHEFWDAFNRDRTGNL